jgi:hypothetical protein
MEETGSLAGKFQGVFGGGTIESRDDDEFQACIQSPLEYGIKILTESRHIEVAVCVTVMILVIFSAHGTILPFSLPKFIRYHASGTMQTVIFGRHPLKFPL